MRTALFVFLFFFFGLYSQVGVCEDKKEPVKKENLSEEDRKVIEMMELLEMMDLLEDMEMIEDLNLIIEE